ncbi:MAG TPA: VOC family protein [Solirubrobacteraceae bacterium]|nr:VOC family protein [Solirubrobacteraceae bacterium]
MAVKLDHVVAGVADLEAAARRLRDRHRLTAVEGGRHASAGTHNMIVPLDDAYLELLAVEDPERARDSPFGRWMLSHAEEPGRWIGWCLRTDDLDALSARLGVEPHAMSRGDLRWRLAGVERAWRDPAFPFFIQWDAPPSAWPGRAGGPTQASDARLTALEVGGDEKALRHWIGEPPPGTVRLASSGPPGIHAVIVAGAGGVEVMREP